MLTLGPNVIVDQATNETLGYAVLDFTGHNHAGDGIVNEGTINAVVNGSFYIQPKISPIRARSMTQRR